MSEPEPVDVTFCHDEATLSGCGQVFPAKTVAGLCRKCAAIEKCPDEERQEKIQNFRQCKDCGVTSQSLSRDICGLCEKVNGVQTKDVVSAAQIHRAEAFDNRMKTAKSQAASQKTPVPTNVLANATQRQAATVLTSAGSSARMTPAGRQIILAFDATVGKKQMVELGQIVRPFDERQTMSEIINEILSSWNTHWTKKRAHSLIREEVELRTAGNKGLAPRANDSVDTLGEFYAYHTADLNKGIFFSGKNQKPLAGISGPFMKLELQIDMDMYRECTQDAEDVAVASTTKGKGRKRVASTTQMPPPALPVKRLRSHAAGSMLTPPISTYSRASSHKASMEMASKIQLVFAVGTTTVDGTVDIMWPADGKPVIAEIGDEEWVQGKTKKVYKLFMRGKSYVAKRFFDVGDGPDGQVTPSDNFAALHADFLRILEGQWFLKAFYDYASSGGQEVGEDFRFATTLFAKEVPGDGVVYPSKASGVAEDDAEDNTGKVCWLIEERRSTEVKKWSGTMSHPQHGGLNGETIVAFTHFTWYHSKQSLVLADMQSTPVRSQDGRKMVLELFDHMTHTYEGNSGVGDHGYDGIDEFIRQHQCNSICRRLGLPRIHHRFDNVQANDEEDRAEDEDEREDGQIIDDP